jgi:hypothetical protein
MPTFAETYESMLASGIAAEVDSLTNPELQPQGDRAVYQAVFRGMQVHGLPEVLVVGGTTLHFIQGPIRVQKTDLSQHAGFPLIFDKSMQHGVEVGAGHWLTVAEIEISEFSDASKELITDARQQALTAIAFLASVLDERIGQEMLAENLLIFDGNEPVAVVDLRELVRHFLPYEVREKELEALAALSDIDLPRHSQTAARWYLRGVQAGPSVDGVIFLWFAVEALTGTSKKKPIEEALRTAGRDPADQKMTVGELHGLRSSFVHDRPDAKPVPPDKVRSGFYDLEAMVKTLLRHELSVHSTWAAHIASRVFDEPWQQRIEEAWASPEVVFHDELPGSDTKPIPEITWGEMLPAIKTKTKVTVIGGQGQDANMIRRIVEIALLFFEDPDHGELEVAIKKPGDPEAVADCRAELLEISPRILPPESKEEAFDLQRLIHVVVGRCLLAKMGVDPNSELGPFLHGILSGWVNVRFLASRGFPIEAMSANPLPDPPTAFAVGEQLGSGLAGSRGNLDNFFEAMAISTDSDVDQVRAQIEIHLGELRKATTPAEMLDTLARDSKVQGGLSTLG